MFSVRLLGLAATAISHPQQITSIAARIRHAPVAALQPFFVASRVGIVSNPIDRAEVYSDPGNWP